MLRRMQHFSKNVLLKRRVSTWSPLTTAFNTRPEKRINFTKNEVVCMRLRSGSGTANI